MPTHRTMMIREDENEDELRLEEVHFLGHVVNHNVFNGTRVRVRKNERVKPRRVRGMIRAAQSEAFKQENVLTERLRGLDPQMEGKGDDSLYFMESNLSFIGKGCNVKDFWLAATT
ncbi:hypothetical protein Tco_0422714 [Tanacetum coccineum]